MEVEEMVHTRWSSMVMGLYAAVGMKSRRQRVLTRVTDRVLHELRISPSQSYHYDTDNAVQVARDRYTKVLEEFQDECDALIAAGVDSYDDILKLTHAELAAIDQAKREHELATWLASKWRRSVATYQPQLDSGKQILKSYLPVKLAAS